MAWIKLETHTPEKPEIHQAAAILNRDHRLVFFHWVRLIVWADANVAEDGLAKGMNLAALSRVAGLDRLAEALAEAGWLTQEPQGVLFSNWTRHNGVSAKQRITTAERRKKERENVKSCCMSDTTPSSLSLLSSDAVFDVFWKTYPRQVGPLAARNAWDKAIATTDPAVIIDAAAAFAGSKAAADQQFVPHPATWLNAGRWMDDRADWDVARGDAVPDKRAARDAATDWSKVQ